jgi:hypothetical protein
MLANLASQGSSMVAMLRPLHFRDDLIASYAIED